MGTTQSKKRRKDTPKKPRGSISYSDTMLPPRSASMDVLHQPGGAASPPTTCPLCPHCQFTASWSSDRSLSNSLCVHHTHQGHQGHQLSMAVDKNGFDSCPDCFQIQETTMTKTASPSSPLSSHSQMPSRHDHSHHNHHHHHHSHHPHLCEISNQDYDEIGTMSLNRKLPGRQGNNNLDCHSNNNNNNNNNNKRSRGIVQSKSVEFGEFRNVQQRSQTKENVNPVFGDFNSSYSKSQSRFVGDRLSYQQNLGTTKRQSTRQSEPISSTEHSFLSALDDKDSRKETKSNLSLLEDEDVIRSHWARHKQRAQELRTLRMHLQHEEDARHQTNSTASHSPPNNFKPYSFQTNEDCVDNKTATTVTESFTSTTNRTVTVTSNVFSSRLPTGLSKFTTTDKDTNNTTNYPATDNTATTTSSTATNSTTHSTNLSPTRRSLRSKFSKLSNYRFLDNHPVMTRLQNEQNNRLELMERRMEEIRISAMQEAERRRFAEIFPAKDDDSETQKRLREARESLERMKEEKRQKANGHHHQQQLNHRHQFRASSAPPRSTNSDDSQSHEDAGDIIPVIHVLSSSRETTPVIVRHRTKDERKTVTVPAKNNHNNAKNLWGQEWPDINLGKPLTWLWLPFMLFPLVLRMLVSLFFTSKATPTNARNGNSVTSTPRWSHHTSDCNRSLPRDKRKKSC